MNDTQKSETVTVETRQEETKKSSNILRESGWYFLWRSGDWYVIDYFSPTYTTNIGYFPREAAAIAIFEQVKEQIPAEAAENLHWITHLNISRKSSEFIFPAK